MRFEDFVLQFDASSRGGFRARVLKSPFGEGGVGFTLPSLTGAELASHDGPGISRDIDHQGAGSTVVGRPPLEIGTELFRSVFQGQVRTLLDKSRGKLEMSPDAGLRLKIKLDPSDTDTGALADLPWELLCDGETEDFFALSRQTSLVRYLDVPRSSQPIPFTPPLKILAVGASPRSLPPLDLDTEVRGLEELNRSASGVEVQFVSHASAGAVREALSGDTFNVLHFMGHGTFDRASGEGMLAFEGSGGALDLVSGKAFATKLRDLRSLGVVMLNACNTARAGHQEGASPFRGVATALVQGGVPAVVAMQRPISDRAAISFSAAFYRHLARGDSVDEALTEGRQAIHSAKPEAFEWATPVLFLRIPEGNVFVARLAERPAEKEVPPLPPAAPPVVSPALGPVSSGRGPALKIAAGAAGAGLVIFVLYTKVLSHGNDANPPAVGSQVETQEPMSSDVDSKPQVDKPKNPGGGKAHQVGLHGTTGSSSQEPVRNPGIKPGPDPSPVESQNATAMQSAPATADLSSLATQVVSISTREEGGLRVTVSFRNKADRPLSVVLDAESSVLSDEQGQRYSVLDSDLPSSGSNPRLDLAASASATHRFDFQAPKLGSKKFFLALLTEDGHRIPGGGGALMLEGSP